MKSLGHGN